MVRLLHYSDVENAYDVPERIGRLAGAIDAARGADSLVVGTGDNTGPGAVALATESAQSLSFFASVDPDAEVIGNHDLDHGLERSRKLIEATPQPWLAANVFEGETRFGRDVGVLDSTVVECDGTAVGLIGVTDPNTPDMCPPAAGLRFTDPIEAVDRAVDRIEAEYVVVLSHVGGGDPSIAHECDVDAVLGGHVHEERVEWIDEVLCSRPGANGETLLEIDLAAGTVTRHAVTEAPVDADVADAVRAHLVDAGLDEIVAHVEEPIERSRAVLRDGETRVGNFVADAYRWTTGADVGLQNTPGLRAGPPLSGDVTRAELVSLVPFDARVVVAEVSGERLRRILAQGDGRRIPRLGDYWHAQVSGATIRRGDPIEVAIGGEPLDADATYQLATTAFLCETNAEFPALRERDVVERYDVQHEVVVEYARIGGIDPSIEERIR